MYEEIQLENFVYSLNVLWKKRLLIIVITIIGMLFGIIEASKQEVSISYNAHSTVYGATYGSYEESNTGINAMLKYKEIAKSLKVCERAVSLMDSGNLTASEISAMVDVSVSQESNIMTISVQSYKENIPSEVANAVAAAFVYEINQIVGKDVVQMLDQSTKVYTDVYDGRKETVLNYTLRAFLAISVILYLIELFNRKLKVISQFIDSEDEKVIAAIPYSKDINKKSEI